MTKEQIATIEQMRCEGMGLSAVAKATGISVNTIKSHYSRHGIPAPRLVRTCMFCHAEINTTGRFCSDACRVGWYESHREEEQDILHICKACGKPFEPRQPKQVYCSKPCFYDDRYHSKQAAIEDEKLRQLLMDIPRKTVAALVKMTIEYLLKSGWSPAEEGKNVSLSTVVDAIYSQNYLHSSSSIFL